MDLVVWLVTNPNIQSRILNPSDENRGWFENVNGKPMSLNGKNIVQIHILNLNSHFKIQMHILIFLNLKYNKHK